MQSKKTVILAAGVTSGLIRQSKGKNFYLASAPQGPITVKFHPSGVKIDVMPRQNIPTPESFNSVELLSATAQTITFWIGDVVILTGGADADSVMPLPPLALPVFDSTQYAPALAGQSQTTVGGWDASKLAAIWVSLAPASQGAVRVQGDATVSTIYGGIYVHPGKPERITAFENNGGLAELTLVNPNLLPVNVSLAAELRP